MATPAQMRDRYQRIAWRYRSIPGKHGLRPYSVEVVTRAYGGPEIGEGAICETRTAIVERSGLPPKVRNLTSEELAVAGYSRATWEIGPITPEFSGGGTDIQALTQDGIDINVEPHVVMTGPEFPGGANFRIIKVQSDKALHYTIQVQRVADGGARDDR